MTGLALRLLYSGDYPYPIIWNSKIQSDEVHYIIDTGNSVLWTCEGKAGKLNRRMSEQWTQLLLAEKIPLEKWGIPAIPKVVVKVDAGEFEEILALPHMQKQDFLVEVNIPPHDRPAPPNTRGFILPEPSKALIGMVKLQRVVDVNEAGRLLHISPGDVRVIIFALAADDKIKGQFEGDIFRITSDVDDFITALDQQFRQWESKETPQHEKID